jgi:hypothetical protein
MFHKQVSLYTMTGFSDTKQTYICIMSCVFVTPIYPYECDIYMMISYMEVYLINLIQFVMRCVTFTSGFTCQCNDVVGS